MVHVLIHQICTYKKINNINTDHLIAYKELVTINIITNKMNTKETEEDPRYSNGKIYQVVSSNTEKIYIGSTILPLDLRFSLHKEI